jgi:hypothetical protein
MLKFSSRTDLETYFSDLAGSECPPNDSPEFEEAVDNLLTHAYSVSDDEWYAFRSDWTEVFDDLNGDTFWALFPAISYEVKQEGLYQIARHLITRVPEWAEYYVHFEGREPPRTPEQLFEPLHEDLVKAACYYAEKIENEAARNRHNIEFTESPTGLKASISYDTDERRPHPQQFNGSPIYFENIQLEIVRD